MTFRSAVLFSALSLALFVASLFVGGCGLLPGVKPPDERAVARGAVLATAAAVAAADEACAKVGEATADRPLLDRCAEHYSAARIALISTGTAVDLWDRAGTPGSVACALGRALVELEQLARDLDTRGHPPPAVIADARALIAFLPRCADGS